MMILFYRMLLTCAAGYGLVMIYHTSRRQCRPNSNSSKPEDIFDPNRLAGYPALIALNAAVAEWSEVHQMARTVIGSVAVHLEGSFDFSNPVASEKVLIFHLLSMKNRGEENPASTLR